MSDTDLSPSEGAVNLESEADIANSYIYINNDGIDNNNHDDIIYNQDNFNNKDNNSNNSNDIDDYNNIPTNNNNKKTNLKRKNDCDDLPRKQFEFRDRKKKNYKI
ncbi:1507_t:CDS:2 [Entrophospora sp. SA101]|nr:18046_t:CDS:2 [Entrophospora sp. SA101]CAJ0923022.1 1507_t:CDS:2 [Entrophospora sp. SA101]